MCAAAARVYKAVDRQSLPPRLPNKLQVVPAGPKCPVLGHLGAALGALAGTLNNLDIIGSP